MQRVNITLDNNSVAKVKQIAKHEGVSVSLYIRRMIDKDYYMYKDDEPELFTLDTDEPVKGIHSIF